MPFNGSGEGDGGPVVELVAHNTFISVLVEQGVIGLALFLGILLVLILSACHFPVLDRAFWLSVLLTWGIGVCSLTWEDRKPSWFLFGVLVAAAGVEVPSMRGGNRLEATLERRFWWGADRPVPERSPEFGRYA